MSRRRTSNHKNPENKKEHRKRHSKRQSDEDDQMNIPDNFESDHDNNSHQDEYEEEVEMEVEPVPKPKLSDKTRDRLKRKIVDWLDYDDKIKAINAKSKKYKDAKKEQEEIIIKMLIKLGVDNDKMDIHDDKNQLRSRVYKCTSVTKGTLKENVIKDALMEAIRDEKKVDQLVKKIESKRPINERCYLKRTKGNKNDL